MNRAAHMGIQLTRFTKSCGPLTKRISLAADGSVNSDGSACIMAQGLAERLDIADVRELAAMIEQLRADQAIALGALRAELPDRVQIATRRNLNGSRSDEIARTGHDIIFRKGQPAWMLLDHDSKGMPSDVAGELQRCGGFWPALMAVLPPLRSVAHVIRRSTSAGLFRTDTGEKFKGSDGLHVYVLVQDGADIERFLKTLHERCWLAGCGWMIISASGQLLERSIVDRMVGAPERLVFEGGPVLTPPLSQDQDSRRPIAISGTALNTIEACPPLTIVETARLCGLKAQQAHCLAEEKAKVRTAFIDRQVKVLAQRTGLSAEAATRVLTRQCDGVLVPDLMLPFDDEVLAGCTVADVLANPARYEGATLADPLEGIDYGRCVAKIVRRADGSPWIHSFAHGRTIYELKHDVRSVRTAIEQAADEAVVSTFIKLTVAADLSHQEIEELRNLTAKRSGVGKRTIAAMLKAARQDHAANLERDERQRWLAERQDPRPAIRAPSDDAPWLSQMEVLNDVIGKSTASHPPARDIDGAAALTAQIAVSETHAFTMLSANFGADND